ncbi:hypothetical protein Q8A67_024909 [Cirrhinus molitorella]|uniref:Uncharacterized protein n=1 Tax=Cirrhinus molitorella TaxID=172907 RepID=A0AA88NZC6_9TELE|nr:hypothetical protein Q8A67_024909 [Cirrhinus molitorella]
MRDQGSEYVRTFQNPVDFCCTDSTWIKHTPDCLLSDRRFVLALRGKEEVRGHRKWQTASRDVSEILQGQKAAPSARVS